LRPKISAHPIGNSIIKSANQGGGMRTLTTILITCVLLWGFVQVAFSGIIPAEFRNNKAGILSLRNTESFDFRVQTIELDGIVLDTVTTVQQNDHQFSSEFSNGGKLLFFLRM
jgi:hypothetical protein